MTRNRKIKLLINDNKRLIQENKRLHELNNESLSKKILSEMERYTYIIGKLYDKYKELDKLRLLGLMNRWKYRWMMYSIKIRRKLGM